MSTTARAVSVWSTFQRAIFKFVETAKGNLVIDAKAGSGKTTTIEECFKRIPKTQSSIFLAFNKSIADALKARGVNARTFHSLCFSPVLRAANQRDVTKDKLATLSNKLFSGDEASMYGAFVRRLVGLARQVGIDALIDDVDASWYALIEHHDLELESERASYADAVALARKLLKASNESPLVDFDDMLYKAVKDGISLPKFDVVFVDEAQDTNAIQRAILRKIMKPTSRLIAVGDPGQAIYGFRGADSESLALIASEFSCKTLPLSVSYRCARSIVAHAQQWVSDILPADDAPEGSVEDLDTKWDHKTFASNDLVVCRTTKPVIALGYRLMKARVPVVILGKDIGEGLISLIERVLDKRLTSSLETLSSKLEAWRSREVEKATAKQQESKVESINDKADAILVIMDGLGEGERTVHHLCGVIRALFTQDSMGRPPVTLSTIHKAKGLEANRVFWLNSSKCPAPWARQPWQQQQEENLCYVATTRAKSTLVLIEEPLRPEAE